MLSNLIKELKALAESILEENEAHDLETRLEQSRELYEKLLILRHFEKEEALVNPVEDEIVEVSNVEPIVEEVIQTVEVSLAETKEKDKTASLEPVKEDKPQVEEDVPLSLNDLFVPTFEGIKEDFSQKEEFKDTVSLDETENMFEVKKEAPRQLSLNDKLVGSSIQVGLNDRIAFVNKLFNFSQSDFNKVLSRLNECKSKEEALKYFQYQVKPNYNWKGKEDLEDRLVYLIERKFM